MASENICCPYCNTRIELPLGSSPRRIVCSRCHETFAHRSPDSGDAFATAPYEPPSSEASSPLPATATGLSSGSIARLVLGFMGVMAIIGLSFMLLTMPGRRLNDVKNTRLALPEFGAGFKVVAAAMTLWIVGLLLLLLYALARQSRRPDDTSADRFVAPVFRGLKTVLALAAVVASVGLVIAVVTVTTTTPGPDPDPLLSPVIVIPPAKLPALGYLPNDTDAIVAVNVAEIASHPDGNEFLNKLSIYRDTKLPDIEATLHLQRQEVDSVVLGLKLQGQFLPRLTLVVQTRRPINLMDIQRHTKSVSVPTDKDAEKLYRIESPKFPVAIIYACPDKYTVIASLSPEDMKAVHMKPASPINHLTSGMQSLLRDRMEGASQLWAASTVEHWDKVKLLAVYLSNRSDDQQKLIGQVRTFGLWLDLPAKQADDITFHAVVKCADADGALKAKEFVESKKPEGLQQFKIEQKADWLTLDAKTTAEGVRKLIP